jgi:hypothetical protein
MQIFTTENTEHTEGLLLHPSSFILPAFSK